MSGHCRLIGEEIWSFLSLASLIFHVYQMKIKVADSEGRWTSKEENSDFIAILHPFFFCIQDGGGKGRLHGFNSAEE